jgi:hypothetical protein
MASGGVTRIDMTAREWHGLIRPVLPHAGTDKEYPALGVVRLELAAHAVYAAATDRYTIGAERWPYPASGPLFSQTVHLSLQDAKASLTLFPFSKDHDPELQVIVDTSLRAVTVVGQARSVAQLTVTIEADDGTRVIFHDVRDPSRDPLAGWRKSIHEAMARPAGRELDGLDVLGGSLARFAAAVRKGERLTVYTGPEPGDPILFCVEHHFAGLLAAQQYLDGPARRRDDLPWQHELTDGIDADDAYAARIDLLTGELNDDTQKEDE